MDRRDLPMGIVLLIIFLALFAYSFTFQSSGVLTTHTTAAFFPRLVLAIAIFFTLIIVVKSIKAPREDREKSEFESVKRVVGSMICAIGFGLGVSYLGTLVSISLFIIAIMILWGVRKKTTILLNALITPIIIYFVFTKILLVQLPHGLLI